MNDLTDKEIAELRRLDGRAASAPWEPGVANLFLRLGDEAVRDVWQGDDEKRNEALACHARNALRACSTRSSVGEGATHGRATRSWSIPAGR
jgi:hypothetical protein